MLTIEERKNIKIPGNSSLFLTFDYNAELVDIVKNNTTVRNYDAKNKTWEVPISDLHILLDKLCQVEPNIILKVLKDTKLIKPINFEIGPFKSNPFKHQTEGIEWGLNNDKGLLLDEPGLGKTIQTIYIAEERRKKFGLEHCLIVCGVNTLKTNWKKEINIHSNLSCRILGERTTKKDKIKYAGVKERLEDLQNPIEDFFVITNIETLRNESIIKELTKKNPVNKFDMIVLDEFHHVKTPTATQTKNFLKLKDAKYKLGLTGTLLTNSPLDCYTALKWLGIESAPFTNFKFYYCHFSGPFNNILVGYRNLENLKEQIDACSLRRTKDLLDLPEKTIIEEEVEMEDTQAQFYENIVNGVIDQVDKVELNTTNLLVMTGRLRQATACPSILTTENIPSAKIDRCIDLVEQIIGNGDKVVVFSVFKETLRILAKELSNYKPLMCTGDIKDTEIEINKELFQEDNEHNIMLCTTQKMGTGVTLNRASYAIFIDTPWTAADFIQCCDRVHRIGSKKPVFIYNLITKDTFDEHVKEIVDDKGMLSDYIIDDKLPVKLTNRLKEIVLDLKRDRLD